MDDHDSDIPGVTFWVSSSSQSGSTDHLANGTVTLRAEIDDYEIWTEVVRRLDGYSVYSIDDFNRQLMIVLREENRQLLERATRAETQAHEQREVADKVAKIVGEQNRELQERIDRADRYIAQLHTNATEAN